MNREQIEQWTDTAAHTAWLETYASTKKSAVNLPESLKNLAVQRLTEILSADEPPESAGTHLAAIDRIIKLATVQVSAASATGTHWRNTWTRYTRNTPTRYHWH